MDNEGAISTSDTNVTVISVFDNLSPVSNAGSDQIVTGATVVYLSGVASSDADGLIETYLWEQTAGTIVTLNSRNTETASFMAPEGSSSTLTFRLIVTDDLGVSDTDYINIRVNNAIENRPPVAYAGADKRFTDGGTIMLNADTSYDVDGEIVGYRWVQTGGTLVNINSEQKITSFIAPSTNEDLLLTFRLTVTDDGGMTDVDDVGVVIKPLLSHVPGAVDFFYGVQGNGENRVHWHTVDNATKYNIYWSLEAGVAKETANKITDVMPPFTHVGLENGTTYYYKITAENIHGESVVSNEIKIITGVSGVSQDYLLKMPVDNGIVTLTYFKPSGKDGLMALGALNNALYSSFYSTKTGWEKPTIIPGSEGISGPYVFSPMAAIKFDSTGKHAILVMSIYGSEIRSAVYEHGEGWSNYQKVAQNAFHDSDAEDYSIDIDTSGNAFVSWIVARDGYSSRTNKINAKYFSGDTKSWGEELIIDPGLGEVYNHVSSLLLNGKVAVIGDRRGCSYLAPHPCFYVSIAFVFDLLNSSLVTQYDINVANDYPELYKDNSDYLYVLGSSGFGVNTLALYKYLLPDGVWETDLISNTPGDLEKHNIPSDNDNNIMVTWLKKEDVETHLYSRVYSKVDSSWGEEKRVSIPNEGSVYDYTIKNDVLMYYRFSSVTGAGYSFLTLNGVDWVSTPDDNNFCEMTFSVNEYNEIFCAKKLDDSIVVQHYDVSGSWLNMSFDAARNISHRYLAGEGQGVLISTYPESIINYYAHNVTDFLQKNSKPISIAGHNDDVLSGSQVILDGTASKDIDGSIVDYNWVQVSGPPAEINESQPGIVEFIAPFVVSVETIEFELTVIDDKGASDTDSMSFRIKSSDKTPPVITLPADITIEAVGVNTPVDIGLATAYDDVSGVVMATTYSNGLFVLGTTSVRWSAEDGAGNSSYALQKITVQDTTPPTLLLDKEVVYVKSDKPTSVMLTKPVAEDLFTPIIIFSDEPDPFSPGETIVTWTAVDANENISSIKQKIIVSPVSGNTPPVAIAKTDRRIVFGNESFILQANNSYDPDGDVISYFWKQMQGPTVDIVNDTLPELALVAPQDQSVIKLLFELVVTDVNGGSDKSNVEVMVYPNISYTGDTVQAGALSGSITSSVILQANQTYEITGDLIIEEGGLLVIEEGAILRMSYGVHITANGMIRVNGTLSNPVKMVSSSLSPRFGELWNGITFNPGSSGSLIKGAIIEQATILIRVNGAEISVIDSHLSSYFYAAIYATNNSKVSVQGSTLQGTISGRLNTFGLYGVSVRQSSLILYDNIIRHNAYAIDYGSGSGTEELEVIGNDISLNTNGMDLHVVFRKQNSVKINDNTINNIEMNISMTTGSPFGYGFDVDVTRNWWGSNNPDDITSKIENEPGSAVIKLIPFLDGPDGGEVVGKYLNGVLDSDFTIDVGDNYTVVGILHVNVNATLTIKPGSTVNFSASSNIFARGVLHSAGTPELPITLTGSVVDENKVYHEAGRVIVNNAETIIRYTNFENFSNGVLFYTKVDITDCVFRDFVGVALRYNAWSYKLDDRVVSVKYNRMENLTRTGVGLYVVEVAKSHFYGYEANLQVQAEGNIFTSLDEAIKVSGNGYGGTYSIELTNNEIYDNNIGTKISNTVKGVILNNNKIYNNDIGVLVSGYYVYDVLDIEVSNNQIYNNQFYNMSIIEPNDLHDSIDVVDARNNWWGTKIDSEIVAKLNGRIRYSPYLDGPNGNPLNAVGPYGYLETDLRLPANTEYTVAGNLYVPADRTLTIESGVTIKVPENKGIFVEGNIKIFGSENNLVRIIPDSLDPIPGIWKGIDIATSNGEFNVFKYVDIQYAETAIKAKGKLYVANSRISYSHNTAIYFNDYEPQPEMIIVNNEIHDNFSGIDYTASYRMASNDYVNRGRYYIAGNYIHNNRSAMIMSGYRSAYVNGITHQPIPNIRSNRITNNTKIYDRNYGGYTFGLSLGDSGFSGVVPNVTENIIFNNINDLSVSSGDVSIVGNDISNGTISIRSRVPQIDISDNWWGTIVNSEIDALIYDGNDDARYAIGNYLPIKTAPGILQTPVFDDYIVSTNPQQFNLTGNAGPGLLVNIYDSAEVLQTQVTSSPDGRFSASITLPEGDNTYYARAKSGDVLTDYSFPVTIKRDTTAPVINITAPLNNSTTSISSSTFSGTLSEKAVLTINGIPVSVDQIYQYNYGVSLTEGLNTFTLQAIDETGNISTEVVTITLDTTPPSQVVQSEVTVGDAVNGSSIINGGVGSAEAGTTVKIINSRTGETVQSTANADGSFNSQISAQTGDMLLIMSIDIMGNTSVWGNQKINGLPESNAITITAPLDGALVLQDFINMRGTFTAPAYSKVTVNGKSALVVANRFYINNVGLNAGVNIVEVKIETPDGQPPQTQAIQVTNNSHLVSGFNDFYVGMAPDNGAVPLATKYKIIANTTDPITQITADFDGDGNVDLTTTDTELLVYTYEQPGEYTANIQIQTASSTEIHQQYVVVYGGQQLDAYLRGLYYTMLDQLSMGNIANGMYFLTPTMQEKYQTAFTNLGAQLQTIIPSLGNVVGGSLYGDVAELYVVRDEEGQNKAFPINMIRGGDGRWRISGM